MLYRPPVAPVPNPACPDPQALNRGTAIDAAEIALPNRASACSAPRINVQNRESSPSTKTVGLKHGGSLRRGDTPRYATLPALHRCPIGRRLSSTRNPRIPNPQVLRPSPSASIGVHRRGSPLGGAVQFCMPPPGIRTGCPLAGDRRASLRYSAACFVRAPGVTLIEAARRRRGTFSPPAATGIDGAPAARKKVHNVSFRFTIPLMQRAPESVLVSPLIPHSALRKASNDSLICFC
jgi:hypothetical protein